MLSQTLYSHSYSNGSLAVVTNITYGFLTHMQADTENTYKFDVKVALIYSYYIFASLSVRR
jgi:hypothetical protein